MNASKPSTSAPYRLRASAALGVAGGSSMLRVARNGIDRRPPTLHAAHAPRQLAFDFRRVGR